MVNESDFPEFISQRFQQIQLLGQGDHTRVYSAVQKDQPVVLKLMQVGQMTDWKLLQLFEREARALMHLQHPRIPKFLDFIVQREQMQYTLVTERVPGQTLSALLDQAWQPNEAEVIDIAVQALQILAYLHAFQPPLIHRDLKPSNLIWDNAKQELYLIDFGGVQERLYAAGSAGSTVVGTFGYMAPEQFAGRTEIRSDLYSLGASLIHLLTGRSPAQLTKKNSPELRFQNYVMCSPQLSAWLGAMVQPNFQQRPESAEAALTKLSAELKLEISPFKSLPAPQRNQRLPSLQQSHQEVEDLRPERLPRLKNTRWLEDLAKGGQHRVWLAQNTENNDVIVVKSLYLSAAQDWKALDMFQREMRTLQQLKHPRIPKFFDMQQEAEQQAWHLLFERMPGKSLRQHLQEGWRPHESELWDIAAQSLEILDYLHQCEPPVLHRDIKPSNLMRDNNDIYLIDFGAVQQPFRPQGAGGSTVIGTYGYMAPEQFSGQAYAATDLYGLGVTLCEIATRCPPEKMPHNGLAFQLEGFLKVSPELQSWLQKLVHPDLARRFPNVAAARADLYAQKKAQQEREHQENTQTLALPEKKKSYGLPVILLLCCLGGLGIVLTQSPPQWLQRQARTHPKQGQIVSLKAQEISYTVKKYLVSAATNKKDMAFNWVNVAPYHSGHIYHSNHQGQIWRINPYQSQTSQVELITPGKPSKALIWELPDKGILHSTTEKNGNLWLVSQNNLWLYHHQAKRWLKWPLPESWAKKNQTKAHIIALSPPQLLLFQGQHWYQLTSPSARETVHKLSAPYQKIVSNGLPDKPGQNHGLAYDGTFFQTELNPKEKQLTLYRYGKQQDKSVFKISSEGLNTRQESCLLAKSANHVDWINGKKHWQLALETQHSKATPKAYTCSQSMALGPDEVVFYRYGSEINFLDGPYDYSWKTHPQLRELVVDGQRAWGLSSEGILLAPLDQFLIQIQKNP